MISVFNYLFRPQGGKKYNIQSVYACYLPE